MAKRIDDGKTGGNYRVDTEVKKKFEAAANIVGITIDEAIEEGMKLFTEKNVKRIVE